MQVGSPSARQATFLLAAVAFEWVWRRILVDCLQFTAWSTFVKAWDFKVRLGNQPLAPQRTGKGRPYSQGFKFLLVQGQVTAAQLGKEGSGLTAAYREAVYLDNGDYAARGAGEHGFGEAGQVIVISRAEDDFEQRGHGAGI